MSEAIGASDAARLTDLIKAEAANLGFALMGACRAVEPAGASRLAEWLARGYAGEMDYLADREAAYSHPRHVLEGTRSIVMLGLPYRTAAPQEPAAGQGRISRYAWGDQDYHDIIHAKLKKLLAVLRSAAPGMRARGVVDSAPLLEREFAQLAGLGWIGKHTLLINKPAGSYFFLAALLTEAELVYDEPFGAEHCGTCRACLDACPTQAFPQPYVLDASRCISYLTIEHRSPIPRELRTGIGAWLFGCDVCQEVCPWNGRAPESPEPALAPLEASNPIALTALFELDNEGFRRRFRNTPLWRSKRRGILRNAAIVLGNQRAIEAVNALVRGLADEEALVRGACAWALAEIGGEMAQKALAERLAMEAESVVIDELTRAMAQDGLR